ncbi:MAG: TfoX/Sxy family protein [Gemmatimonadota bacterium]
MAQPYLDQLIAKLDALGPVGPAGVTLECKHFFSGAALYADGKVAASLTPAGFAIKLPEATRSRLLESGEVEPLRYFPGAPVKSEYVVLSEAMASRDSEVRELLDEGIRFSMGAERGPD